MEPKAKSKSRKITFETNLNTVWTDGDGAYIKHNKNGVIVKFDADAKIVDAVISSIINRGNFQYNPTHKEFIAMDSNANPIFSLRQLIYSVANDVGLDEVKDFFLRNFDGDKSDCRSSNIDASIPFVVSHDEKHIILSNGKDVSFFTDYAPNLFEIISSKKWYHHKSKDQLFFNGEKHNNNRIFIHQLCWCYFNRSDCNLDNYEDIVWEFKQKCKEDYLSIDHKNNCHANNRKVNLELMPQNLNAKKRNITKLFQAHHFYAPTLKGEFAGKIEIKDDVFSKFISALSGILIFDIYVLPDGDQETRIINLRNLAKKDVVPENAIHLKTSWLQYGLILSAICKMIGNVQICEEKTV